MLIKLKVIFILVIVVSIHAQEYKLYEGSLVDVELSGAMLQLLENQQMTMSKDTFQIKSDRVSFGESIPCFERDVNYYLQYGWGNKQGIQANYDIELDSIKSPSYYYKTLSEGNYLIGFHKIDNEYMIFPAGIMDTIEKPVDFNLLKKYKITNNNLFVEIEPDVWTPIFIRLESPFEYSTPLGKIVYTNFYEKKEFFGQTFCNVYEYFLIKDPDSACHDYLIWFTEDYDIIRLDDRGGGYSKLEK